MHIFPAEKAGTFAAAVNIVRVVSDRDPAPTPPGRDRRIA